MPDVGSGRGDSLPGKALMQGCSLLGGGCAGLFLMVWTLGWSVGTLAGDYAFGGGILRQWQARRYLAVPAVIERSAIKEESDSDGGTSHTFEVAYRYEVGGRLLRGERYRHGMNFGGRDRCERLVGLMPVGQKVSAYVDPAAPEDRERVVLDREFRGADVLPLIFLLPFNLIMVGSWYTVIGGGAGLLASLRGAQAPAGGVAIWQRERLHVARLDPPSPVWRFLATIGAASFAMIFLVGLPFGGDPPLWLVEVLGGATLALALKMALAAHLRLAGGHFDLVIDPLERRISWPIPWGGEQRQEVPWEVIDDLLINAVTTGSGEDETTRYHPRVVFSGAGGGERRLANDPWPGFSGRDQAEAFRAWVLAQLGRSGPVAEGLPAGSEQGRPGRGPSSALPRESF